MIGLVSAFGVVWVGWWSFPIVLGLVLVWGWIERRTGRAPKREPGELRRGLPGLLAFCGAIFGLYLIATRLFSGYATFFVFMGPIFLFWLVCCVIVPMRRARTLRPQS